MTTRREHLEWCKARALAYLPGEPHDAFSSLMSDLTEHPEPADHPWIAEALPVTARSRP